MGADPLPPPPLVLQETSRGVAASIIYNVKNVSTLTFKQHQVLFATTKLSLYFRSMRTQNSGKYDWNCTDPTIPSGWKSRVVEGKLRRTFYLCPDGSVFACRRSGFQHMVQNKFPSEEIESMRKLLTHEGWKFADFLPKGICSF